MLMLLYANQPHFKAHAKQIYEMCALLYVHGVGDLVRLIGVYTFCVWGGRFEWV